MFSNNAPEQKPSSLHEKFMYWCADDDNRQAVTDILHTLNKTERAIIYGRCLIPYEKTLIELSSELGLAAKKVQAIEYRVIRHLIKILDIDFGGDEDGCSVSF